MVKRSHDISKSRGTTGAGKSQTRSVTVRTLGLGTGHYIIQLGSNGICLMKKIRDGLGIPISKQRIIEDGKHVRPWSKLSDGNGTYHLVAVLGPDYSTAPRDVRNGSWRCNECKRSHKWPNSRKIIVDCDTGRKVCPHSYCDFSGLKADHDGIVQCRHCNGRGFEH